MFCIFDFQLLAKIFCTRKLIKRTKFMSPHKTCFNNYLCRILSILHIPVEKCSANHLQEFDFIFPLILALCVANLIFSCWAVSPTYCIKQFEHVIKYIILDELHVT